MPMVYIQCPDTGNLVPTNYILPDVRKLKEPIQRHVNVVCHYCNKIHVWNDQNGFFLGGEVKTSK